MPELRWTNEKPTTPGWYWWRLLYSQDIIVELRLGGGVNAKQLWVLDYLDIARPLKDVGGQWAGPIEEPQEAS